MHRPTSRLRTLGKPLAGLAALSLLVTACGDDDDEAAVVDPVTEEEPDELITPQLNGLEVTVTGNVTELLGDEGFQIDKDGLGDETTPVVDPEDGIDTEADYFVGVYDIYDYYDYDYDYYDYDYYTAFDAELDEFDESSVVVITPGGSEVAAGEAVQVNGTLRYFDEVEIEEVYDVDLDDDVFGSYENQYVIVADAVKSVHADRETGESSAGTSTTMAGDEDATSTTTTATDDAANGEDAGDAASTSTTTGDTTADEEQPAADGSSSTTTAGDD